MKCSCNNNSNLNPHSGWFDSITNEYITQFQCSFCNKILIVTEENKDFFSTEDKYSDLLRSLPPII